MARIRSTHPGQWTSGDFLECSPLARLLALAVRNVADDHGVFRWKPTSLKAECLPADNCDMHALLEELVRHNQVVRYWVDGKEYGIIKDFMQWQRPQKPKYIHPVPDWFDAGKGPVPDKSDTSTGLDKAATPTSPVPVPDQSRTSTGKAPQRKEVGGRRKEEDADAALGGARESVDPPATKPKLISDDAYEIATEVMRLMGLDPHHPFAVGSPFSVQGWLNGGWPREAILAGVARVMQRRKGDPPSTLKYFENAIARSHAELTRVLPVVVIQSETVEQQYGSNRKIGGSLNAAIDADIARTIEEINRASVHEAAVQQLSD